MLLSRVAETLYWAARYLERAEDTARIVREHTNHPRLASRGNWRGCGRTDTGTVHEQEIALEGFAKSWRCIELMLDAPTEDG